MVKTHFETLFDFGLEINPVFSKFLVLDSRYQTRVSTFNQLTQCLRYVYLKMNGLLGFLFGNPGQLGAHGPTLLKGSPGNFVPPPSKKIYTHKSPFYYRLGGLKFFRGRGYKTHWRPPWKGAPDCLGLSLIL